MSAETVSNCAVRWTSRTSGQRPADTVGRCEGRDDDGIASSRLKTRWKAVEEHSRKCLSLFQQNPNFLEIIPNIPEVLMGSTAHYRSHGAPAHHASCSRPGYSYAKWPLWRSVEMGRVSSTIWLNISTD